MNALILSAGMGSRIPQFSTTSHKALIELKEQRLIEYTIEHLWAAGIFRIVIVVGYHATLFEYLVSKYPGVELVFNERYEDYNNAYSFYRALDFLEDTWVIEADLFLRHNVFLERPSHSTYYLIERLFQDKEWIPQFEDDRVIGFEIEKKALPSHSGISFWKKKDTKRLIEKARWLFDHQIEFYQDPTKYWDHIPIQVLEQLDVKAKLLPKGSVYEMDSYEDYLKVLEVMNHE